MGVERGVHADREYGKPLSYHRRKDGVKIFFQPKSRWIFCIVYEYDNNIDLNENENGYIWCIWNEM